MPRLDVQADLRARLEAALGVEVMTHVPAPRPATLVVVRREGGARRNRLIDAPGVGIDCWAPTEAEAASLADRASDVMASLEFADGYDVVREETVRSHPDVLTGSPRWYLSYSLATHVPPAEEEKGTD